MTAMLKSSDSTSTIRESRKCEPLHMVEMVFPSTTNHYGTMFGGKVLDLMDRAAFLAATRFSNQAMVTASMEHIDFYVPVKHGNLVELIATIVYTGRTSLTVRVVMYSENPIQKTRDLACEGYFHMVSVDEDGRPIPIPMLIVDDAEAQAEWDKVLELRAVKNKMRRNS